jgi:hypothetical protein
MEVSGQLHAPVAIWPNKKSQTSLNRKLGGPRGRFRRLGEGNNNIPLLREEPQFLGRPAHASYCGNINKFDYGRSVVVTQTSGKD